MLRLAWTNPTEPAAPRAAAPLALVAAPLPLRARVNLALAIEGHLAGDGRSDAEFAALFATGAVLPRQ